MAACPEQTHWGRPICYSLGAAWHGREPGDLRSFYTLAPVARTTAKTALAAPTLLDIAAPLFEALQE